MKKRLLYMLIAAVFMFAGSVHAADVVSTDGTPNSSGIYPIQVDSDRVITIASDAGMKRPYEVVITSDTITAKETGKIFAMDCTTYCEMDLPAAAVGTELTFVSTDDTSKFELDPNGTDIIYYSVSSNPLSAGDKMVSPGTTGDSVTLFCATANTWAVTSINGTFTDGN